MLLSHNWLKNYYTNPEVVPAPEKVADIFTMHAFEIESLTQKGEDYIYDLKITADRAPYALGIRYIAMELSLLVPELVLRPEIWNLSESDSIPEEVDEKIIIATARDFCSVYSLTKIENVTNSASPEWITIALTSIDQQSRGLLVDLTNLSMFDTGQPLHVFDADKVEGQIRVDVSQEGEMVTILGGKEVSLPANTLVIRDDTSILAIAGVKGGVKAEVTATTKNIYLESALFNGPKVRRTARSLILLNDSSKRFEQQLTPERYRTGQNTYIHLLKHTLPEAVFKEIKVSNTVESTPRKITVDVSKAVVSINKNDATVAEKFTKFLENILPKTGAQVEKDGSNYIVTAPEYRSDLQTEADVVDEFLRNVGYDFLTYTEPKKNPVQGLKNPIDKLVYVLRNFFINQGFDEVALHSLVDSKVDSGAVVLANALTSERNSLRSDLAKNMSAVLDKNLKHLDLVSKNKVQLFEIGNIFIDQGNNLEEKLHLAFGVSMVKWPKGESAETYLSILVDKLKLYLNCESLDTVKNNVYEISIEKLLPQVKNNLDDLVKNIESYKIPENIKYKKASIYPSMSRDIAFFGSSDETEVVDFIKTQVEKNPLIENHFQFDKFTKEDKTSYGYRFVFQSYDQTLTEETVTGIYMKEIADTIAAKGWMVR